MASVRMASQTKHFAAYARPGLMESCVREVLKKEMNVIIFIKCKCGKGPQRKMLPCAIGICRICERYDQPKREIQYQQG